MHGDTEYRTAQGRMDGEGRELTSNIEFHIHTQPSNATNSNQDHGPSDQNHRNNRNHFPQSRVLGLYRKLHECTSREQDREQITHKKPHEVSHDPPERAVGDFENGPDALVYARRITSPALMATTSVPELTDTPVSACVRASISFVPSPVNITWALRSERPVKPDCSFSWTVRTKSAFDLGVHPPMALPACIPRGCRGRRIF